MTKELRLENGAVLRAAIVMNLDRLQKHDHVICKSAQCKQHGPNGRNYHHVHRLVEVVSRLLDVNVLMELLVLMMVVI